MLYYEIYKKELKTRLSRWFWEKMSLRLARKYVRLSIFSWETFEEDGDIHILCSSEDDDDKRYYLGDSKESYLSLKNSLELELKIRYR